ncbi:hypothetical protein M9H77_24745 [Catharanthus roseus]|uniref:Uncharacterized protein n=1 Tax=Catharanthus roseus TaxID=4058 RepID=A0ACC0A7M4_CATRO|nr:hypothetical protein M9H77_24745 [Catharanthus roseus]
MQQGGDYSSYYPYPPNPVPIPSHQPPPYASAPPFSANNPSSAEYSSPYPSFPQNSDPVPTAPAFSPVPNFPTQPPQQQTQPSASFPQFETSGSYHQLPPQSRPAPQPYYSAYDPPQLPQHNYTQTLPNPVSNSIPNTTYSSAYSPQFNQVSSSAPPVYDTGYDNNLKFDQHGGYFDEFSGRYGSSGRERSDFGSEFYGKRVDSGYGIDGFGDGVYAYKGSKVEPYGARGTAPKSSTWSGFDDFGRPIGYSSEKDRSSSGSTTKIVRAVPKADTQHDVKSGVQKFRVKLLAESGGQSTMDVLCQIGLDGIRMLDPSTSRTLRIYPLDTITRCEVTDSSTLSFWSKSSVDIDPRRIRLQSNSYTTNTLLDTVFATIAQFEEIGGRSRPSETSKLAEPPTEKKRGFGDWMNFMKATNEEKDHWVI